MYVRVLSWNSCSYWPYDCTTQPAPIDNSPWICMCMLVGVVLVVLLYHDVVVSVVPGDHPWCFANYTLNSANPWYDDHSVCWSFTLPSTRVEFEFRNRHGQRLVCALNVCVCLPAVNVLWLCCEIKRINTILMEFVCFFIGYDSFFVVVIEEMNKDFKPRRNIFFSFKSKGLKKLRANQFRFK